MDKSWVKLYRKSLKSSIWVNPDYWFIWCWILMRAGHEIKHYPFNGKDIKIEEGSFITGRSKALQELPHITAQKYKSAISYLISTNRITIKTTNKFTIIQVQNWKSYQQIPEEITSKINNQQTTSKQPVTTNKNIKNIKKILTTGKPETKIDYLSNIPIEDISGIENISGANEQQIRTKGLELLDWCHINGKKKKDYKAFLRVAVIKDYPKQQPNDKSSMETYGYIKR